MQTPLTTFEQVPPGGTGFTVGENECGPPADFSVGAIAGDEDTEDGVVVFGSSLVLLPQPAVRALIAMIADPPSRSVA